MDGDDDDDGGGGDDDDDGGGDDDDDDTFWMRNFFGTSYYGGGSDVCSKMAVRNEAENNGCTANKQNIIQRNQSCVIPAMETQIVWSLSVECSVIL